MQEHAQQYDAAAAMLKRTIRNKYWDATRKLFADTPEKNLFSQHTNALAILTGIASGTEAGPLAQKIIHDTALTQATIYFKFYVYQALTKAGLGDGYLNWLDIWKQNIAMGMTTWAEISDINNTRSDCHAWGASPNIELCRIVLGIDSDAPGFKKIKITPHLGTLAYASGTIPHPSGNISVGYEKDGNNWKISATIPANTPAYLLWNGKKYELRQGKNSLALASR
jgi:alpha-L-rhamnosidase